MIGRPLSCPLSQVKTAKTVLNWAGEDEVGSLSKNPWKKIKKLPERGRERIVTDEEFRALVRHCSDLLFKEILFVLRYTAARPGKLRKLTSDMPDGAMSLRRFAHHSGKTGFVSDQRDCR